MKKILWLLVFLVFFIPSYSLNFSIAPTNFKVDLNTTETEEAHIINNTSHPLRIEVYLDKAEGYEEADLNENIVVYPKKISIKPGGKQTVRFKFIGVENLKKGEYKSLMVFKEVPSKIKNIEEKEEEGFSANFDFITEVAIGVKGTK